MTEFVQFFFSRKQVPEGFVVWLAGEQAEAKGRSEFFGERDVVCKIGYVSGMNGGDDVRWNAGFLDEYYSLDQIVEALLTPKESGGFC